MPRAPATIRKRYVEGTTEVCPWDVEETLLYGCTQIIGPPSMFRSVDEWRREWQRWGDIIMPKVLEHRPGTRPFALYAIGEIPAREPRMPLPVGHGFWQVDVHSRSGKVTRHHIGVPMPYMRPEVEHLRDLGIVDADELRRHREWMSETNPDCDTCAVDHYPLEMSLYE